MNKTTLEALKQLREVHEAQGRDGNWDYDQYMRGLFNGLELALAIFEGRDPVYREALAEPVKRPQNCGTGYCSCIECPYEPVKDKQ